MLVPLASDPAHTHRTARKTRRPTAEGALSRRNFDPKTYGAELPTTHAIIDRILDLKAKYASQSIALGTVPTPPIEKPHWEGRPPRNVRPLDAKEARPRPTFAASQTVSIASPCGSVWVHGLFPTKVYGLPRLFVSPQTLMESRLMKRPWTGSRWRVRPPGPAIRGPPPAAWPGPRPHRVRSHIPPSCSRSHPAPPPPGRRRRRRILVGVRSKLLNCHGGRGLYSKDRFLAQKHMFSLLVHGQIFLG